MTRRDDLESLAYTLFSILRGCLPWDKSHVHTSTPRGVRRQVLAKKQAWSGARLAEEYDPAFGQFLDEIRGLEFNETPPYGQWQLVFACISERQGVPIPFDFGATDITGMSLFPARFLHTHRVDDSRRTKEVQTITTIAISRC